MSDNKTKVLIIEDNEDLNEMFKTAFEAKGYDVAVSLNGMDGITKAAEFKPDVILLDIMMPQMNGYEVLSALKNNTSLPSKVVINSNLEQEGDTQKAMSMGADLYLKKSEYTPFEAVEKVDELLGK
ncbi:response regulator [Candidatus Gracilibacteria bacterium]|nr:response regulator [Candidatus Gracilibacteria bacterium]MCF7856710.1 response regulator [Candidatus Gracilibacteria bacterium]MCF7897016.1 response regulator [Candidatus Gracilibacteria bacterium]